VPMYGRPATLSYPWFSMTMTATRTGCSAFGTVVGVVSSGCEDGAEVAIGASRPGADAHAVSSGHDASSAIAV